MRKKRHQTQTQSPYNMFTLVAARLTFFTNCVHRLYSVRLSLEFSRPEYLGRQRCVSVLSCGMTQLIGKLLKLSKENKNELLVFGILHNSSKVLCVVISIFQYY